MDLVLIGGVMLTKSSTQFSVDGQGCVPSLLFDLRPNYGEVMRIMATSSRRSQACTAAFRAPDPAAGHRQPTPLLETPGHSWANLGQSLVQTLLLSPGSWCMQGFVYTLQGSVSPVLCKFWWLYGGVNGNLLQEGYAIPRSAAPRTPAPAAGHC